MASRDPTHLVWLDLETTGLDPESAVILEIATLVTDKTLSAIVEGPSLVIHQSDAALASMDPWCSKQHGRSGLLDEVRRSTVDLASAEAQTLAFVAAHCPPQRCPLCGNSICFDRRFLIRHMPALNAHLHYRNVDVTSIKELVARWVPNRRAPEKASRHRASSDIHESLDELIHYRKSFFGA